MPKYHKKKFSKSKKGSKRRRVKKGRKGRKGSKRLSKRSEGSYGPAMYAAQLGFEAYNAYKAQTVTTKTTTKTPIPSLGSDKEVWNYKPFQKGHPKDTQLVELNTNLTVRLASTTGLQSIAGFDTYLKTSELSSMSALFTIAPAQSQKIYYKGLRLGMRFANMANTQCTLRIYIAAYRFDNANIGNMLTDWTSGCTNEGGTGSATNPDCTPFQSKLFCQRNKVRKVFKRVLDPGARWDLDIGLNINRYISNERVINAAQIGGVTHAIFYSLYGGIENDSTTKTQISYAAAAVDMICSYRYEAFCPPLDNTIISTATNLPPAFTVAGEAMNETTETVETQIIA
nr:MAG: capsid protein [Cressdnaviricota sp.]